ncbi:MAG: hypothetical protein ACHQIM_04705 [Sphingobacteriales bacterium]
MKKPFAFTYCLLLLITLVFPRKTFAGWPIGKYRDLVIPSFSYYNQTDHFDNSDNVVKGAPGTGFTSFSANLLVGYGISRKLDFIASVPYIYTINKLAPGNTLNNQGAGDLVAGLSYNLVNFNFKRFLSVQVSGVVPLYANSSGNSALGFGDYGSEVKLMFCGNMPAVILDKGYFNTELSYRKYYGTQGPDQLSLLGTIGYPVTKHNQVSIDLLFFKSFSSDKVYNPNFFAQRDFAFFKPALNFGHTFTRRFSLFTGGYFVPFGLNTGVGYGGSVLAVFKL